MQLITIVNFSSYKISSNGYVWSTKRSKFLVPSLKNNGYLQVGLWNNKKRTHIPIHRLVLEAFVGICPDGMECRHLDGNKINNHISNLRWGTHKENIQDAIKHGVHRTLHQRGSNNSMAKLTERDVINIIHLYNTKLFYQREIAGMYNITQGHVGDIVNGKRWKHLVEKDK